jgi:hypothetical protein
MINSFENIVKGILDLPGEMFFECLLFAEDERKLNNYRRVNKIFKTVIDSKNFGKKLYGEDFWDLKKKCVEILKEKKGFWRDEISLLNKNYRTLKLIFKLFGGKGKFYGLPSLKIGDKMGKTGYIDFIKPDMMRSSIMRGKDKYGRLFFVIKVKQECEPSRDRGHVLLLFKKNRLKKKLDREKLKKFKKSFKLKKKSYSAPICQAFFCRSEGGAFAVVYGGARVIKFGGALIDYGRIENKRAYEELKILILKGRVTIDKNSKKYSPKTYVLE